MKSITKTNKKNNLLVTIIINLLLAIICLTPITYSKYISTCFGKSSASIAKLRCDVEPCNINFGELSNITTKYLYSMIEFSITNANTDVSYNCDVGLNVFSDIEYNNIHPNAFPYSPSNSLNNAKYFYRNNSGNMQTGNFTQAVGSNSGLSLSNNKVYYAISIGNKNNYTWYQVDKNEVYSDQYYFFNQIQSFTLQTQTIYYKALIFFDANEVSGNTVYVGYKLKYEQVD